MNRLFFLIYDVLIRLYVLAIRLAALFVPKAELWVKGRRDLLKRIGETLAEAKEPHRKIAWFHCASLGEYEQGRPLMEELRNRMPEYRIFLTFYSPSGYEVRKNYAGADFIFYLPADTRRNAGRFIELVRPSMAIFIKYEYWFNYLDILSQNRIPVYLVSAIFRPDHPFFRWYGRWAKQQLGAVTRFFVQDEASGKILEEAGFRNVTLSGDTRFDRVSAIAEHVKSFPAVERFCRGHRIFLMGSSWPEDEKVCIPVLKAISEEWKFIIAPHETAPSRISALVESLPFPSLKFSEATGENIGDQRILIIDSIGMLAHLYRHATVAFIGGGFRTGLHNILEAAVFGIPVIFGPEYRRFNEAKELVALGGAFSITGTPGLFSLLYEFRDDPAKYRKCGEACREYVTRNRGATLRILEEIHG
jgi:3-deoxy-D-manno-octulosonic-acid transferase